MRLDHALLLLPLFEALKPLQKILKHRVINQPEVSYAYLRSKKLAEPVFLMKFECFGKGIYFWYFYQENNQWYAYKCGQSMLGRRLPAYEDDYVLPKLVSMPMTAEQLASVLMEEIQAIQD